MSRGSPRSWKVRAIDISGVMPLPPERNRYFGAEAGFGLGVPCMKQEKSPIGPMACSTEPTFT